MADFLSTAWLAELDDAARDAPGIDLSEALVVEARITGGADGDVVFHLTVTHDGTRVHAGAAPRAVVSIVTDHRTARALHRGESNAQRALAAGLLKVRGDLGALGRTSEGIAALGDLFGPVRAHTTSA